MRRAHTATARCSQHTPRFSSSTTFLRHTSQETGGKVIADPTLAESPASPGPRQELYHVGDGSPGGNDPVAQRRGLLDGRGSIEAHPRHILWDDHGGALNGPLFVLCRFLSRQLTSVTEHAGRSRPAPTHDAVRVPLRCVPCGRARGRAARASRSGRLCSGCSARPKWWMWSLCTFKHACIQTQFSRPSIPLGRGAGFAWNQDLRHYTGPPATSSRRVILVGAYTSSAHKRGRHFCAP